MVSLDKNCTGQAPMKWLIDFTGQAGWAQVNGRNAISWEDKFKLDVWYVGTGSFNSN
jgi:lipopolysaccharide/colanic/teichoic acid biosynthesis glycosyltransferase